MRLRLACVVAVVALGCDRGPGKAGSPGTAVPTDAQSVEAAWKRWQECVTGGDGSGAWSCLSKRTRADRSTLYRADAARLKGLSGPELDAEARSWGLDAGAIRGLGAEGLAALALGRELRRPECAAAEQAGAFTGADIKGDLAVVLVKVASGRTEAIAFVREDGAWRLDDAESRRAAASPAVPK